jgi:hypothetical protein
MSGPHDFAVRFKRVRLSRPSVHRIPRQRFVTIAKRPSERARDARENAGDLPDIASQLPAAHWHDGQISRDQRKAVK